MISESSQGELFRVARNRENVGIRYWRYGYARGPRNLRDS
jgi:hypothetical protein